MTSEDPDRDRPRPLLGGLFWAMIVLSAVCVAAGVAIVRLAPLGERVESR